MTSRPTAPRRPAADRRKRPEPVDRNMLDRSESGAPASGHAVRDLFSTDEIFQRLVASADEEFVRPPRLLFFSGLAAGLSVALSFVARASVTAATGGEAALVSNLLYPVGFLIIVLGRYQLFTENTLAPVVLVLARIASIRSLLRLWGIVLAANLLGATIMGWILAKTGVFDPDSITAAMEIAQHPFHTTWDDIFWKAVFAGWLVASMVWLNHAARDTITRFFLVFAIMFLVPTADLYHCITGTSEAMFFVFRGGVSLAEAITHFLVPVVLGNTAGGVLLVALVNFAQTRTGRFPDRDVRGRTLTWRRWLFGVQTGNPEISHNAPVTGVDEEMKGAETGSLLDQPVPEETQREAEERGEREHARQGKGS